MNRAGNGSEPLRAGQLAGLVAAVVACRLFAVHSFWIYDDAFITYRYAQNLAHGAGLVFNPGADWEPVLGTTAPLYAVLLAAAHAVGLPIVSTALALNVACDVAIALLLCHGLRERPFAAAIAAVAFASIPQVARISVGGMEPPLFVLLALGAACLAESGRLALAGVLAGLACGVRPEGLGLAFVLPLFHVRTRRDAARLLVPFAALALALAAALIAFYGDWLPQSVRAKAQESGTRFRLDRWGDILARAFGPSLEMRFAFPFAALGMALLIGWRTRLRAFTAFALAIVGAYLATSAKTWGWYFYAPLVAWCAGLGLGIDALREFASRARPSARLERLVALSPAVLAFVGVTSVAAFTRMYPDPVTPQVYEPLNAWARTSGLAEKGARVVASDIGAIGYLGGGVILDTEGLVWPEARRHASQVEVIVKHDPDYVVLVVNQARLPPFFADPVSARYEPIARFNTTGDLDLEPRLDRLPESWEQDYIVYRRRREPTR